MGDTASDFGCGWSGHAGGVAIASVRIVNESLLDFGLAVARAKLCFARDRAPDSAGAILAGAAPNARRHT